MSSHYKLVRNRRGHVWRLPHVVPQQDLPACFRIISDVCDESGNLKNPKAWAFPFFSDYLKWASQGVMLSEREIVCLEFKDGDPNNAEPWDRARYMCASPIPQRSLA